MRTKHARIFDCKQLERKVEDVYHEVVKFDRVEWTRRVKRMFTKSVSDPYLLTVQVKKNVNILISNFLLQTNIYFIKGRRTSRPEKVLA